MIWLREEKFMKKIFHGTSSRLQAALIEDLPPDFSMESQMILRRSMTAIPMKRIMFIWELPEKQMKMVSLIWSRKINFLWARSLRS